MSGWQEKAEPVDRYYGSDRGAKQNTKLVDELEAASEVRTEV
jgi:hypothetical protein